MGHVWTKIDPRRREAFLYEILVFPQFREKGYGSAAIEQLAQLLRQRGLKKLDLHVFGHNQRAFALYERLGFRVTNINMTKDLSSH